MRKLLATVVMLIASGCTAGPDGYEQAHNFCERLNQARQSSAERPSPQMDCVAYSNRAGSFFDHEVDRPTPNGMACLGLNTPVESQMYCR